MVEETVALPLYFTFTHPIHSLTNPHMELTSPYLSQQRPTTYYKTYTEAALIHSTSYTNSLTLKHIKISNDTQFAIFHTYILVMESLGLLLQKKCMVLLVKTMPMILI